VTFSIGHQQQHVVFTILCQLQYVTNLLSKIDVRDIKSEIKISKHQLLILLKGAENPLSLTKLTFERSTPKVKDDEDKSTSKEVLPGLNTDEDEILRPPRSKRSWSTSSKVTSLPSL
jgi:hypothetical protein